MLFKDTVIPVSWPHPTHTGQALAFSGSASDRWVCGDGLGGGRLVGLLTGQLSPLVILEADIICLL